MKLRLSADGGTARIALLIVIVACAEAPSPDRPAEDSATRGAAMQQVFTYRACAFARPGELVSLPRTVSAHQDPVTSAVAELVKGVTQDEAAQGCTSFFSARTQHALRAVQRNARGDTVIVDFRNFANALPEAPAVKSFLPPGVMAELTWTLFHQFEQLMAVRISFDGDEQAFWHWLGGPETPAQVFTRTDWEQI